MKIVVFTNNSIRHKFVANSLTKKSDDALIISECNPNELVSLGSEFSTTIADHFKLRYETEQKFFSNNDYFEAKILPIMYKEASLHYTFEMIKKFNPDMMFVFGASILKGPIMSLLQQGRFINLHLGLSPYYRGSGTNLWPFVNKELEYVGSTILHLDEGIDTGDIICHIRPSIESGDNVHTIGCKVIKESVKKLIEIIEFVDSGGILNRVKQWEIPNPRYYQKRDFNEEILQTYYENLQNGLIEDYIQKPKEIKLVNL